MIRHILKTLAVCLFMATAMSSSAEALSYTRYDLSGQYKYDSQDKLHSHYFKGFAIFNNGSVMNIGDNMVSQEFLIPKFFIKFDTGDVFAGSGYLTLCDFYSEGTWDGANHHWELGPFHQYSPTGGANSVSEELQLYTSLPVVLPEYFEFQGGFQFSNPEAVPAVPEPGTCMLLAAGVLLLVFRSKRRQSRITPIG